jgi:hypothetical protein
MTQGCTLTGGFHVGKENPPKFDDIRRDGRDGDVAKNNYPDNSINRYQRKLLTMGTQSIPPDFRQISRHDGLFKECVHIACNARHAIASTITIPPASLL